MEKKESLYNWKNNGNQIVTNIEVGARFDCTLQHGDISRIHLVHFFLWNGRKDLIKRAKLAQWYAYD